MISIETYGQDCKSFASELQAGIRKWVEERINQRLVREMDKRLARRPHQRRKDSPRRQGMCQCQQCGSRQVQDFSRNGYRQRQLVTNWGIVDFALPRAVCQCGGSVQVPLGIIEPQQRIWGDVIGQVQAWAVLGLSLRQMQTSLGKQVHTSMGLATLNQMVQAVRTPSALAFTRVPPVVMLDGIWVTLLRETGDYKEDQTGRRRAVKHKEKVCVLVALGVYPESGQWGVLAWALADGESQAAWEPFLVGLDTRGLYRQRGLSLLIHDGGDGLEAALRQVYPQVPHQRCRFHKFQNLRSAMIVPEGLSRAERKNFKTDLLNQIRPIFDAPDIELARQMTAVFDRDYRDTQPRLVKILRTDWLDNFAFLPLLARFPAWKPRSLRTTSLLERVNRMIRRLSRAANAFHSPTGLLATVSRVLLPFRLV